jgi:hypothetical protein
VIMVCITRSVVGDRETHGSYRYGMLTCSIRGVSCPSTMLRIIVLTVVEGGMRRTVPDSPAWMC